MKEEIEKTSSSDGRGIEFVVFCIERFAQKNELSGAVVAQKFEKFGVLDFLGENYEALHTQGELYILQIIEEYMAKQEEQR